MHDAFVHGWLHRWTTQTRTCEAHTVALARHWTKAKANEFIRPTGYVGLRPHMHLLWPNVCEHHLPRPPNPPTLWRPLSRLVWHRKRFPDVALFQRHTAPHGKTHPAVDIHLRVCVCVFFVGAPTNSNKTTRSLESRSSFVLCLQQDVYVHAATEWHCSNQLSTELNTHTRANTCKRAHAPTAAPQPQPPPPTSAARTIAMCCACRCVAFPARQHAFNGVVSPRGVGVAKVRSAVAMFLGK